MALLCPQLFLGKSVLIVPPCNDHDREERDRPEKKPTKRHPAHRKAGELGSDHKTRKHRKDRNEE